MQKAIFLSGRTIDEIMNILKKSDFDTVLLPEANTNSDSILKLKSEFSNISIYSVADVFSTKGAEEFDNIYPIDSHGILQKNYNVCPTHEEFRKAALDKIKRLISLNVDGIWLNYISYSSKWSLLAPEIVDTCYCERCLSLFEEYIGEKIQGVGGEGNEIENKALYIDGSYYHEWLEFKTGYINSFVKEVRNLIQNSGKDIKLGIFAIPWDNSEYGDAIKRILGQDFNKLAELVDVFSPMLYHKKCSKDVSWVKNRVDYFWNFGKPILPIIEETEDLEEAKNYASGGISQGYCVLYR